MTSETEATKRDHIKNQVAADVVKVVCDYPYWHTFGGLCIDSSWGNHELIEADNGTTYLSLPIVVTYRTNENDPYVLRT
jgi:hypothetical protein